MSTKIKPSKDNKKTKNPSKQQNDNSQNPQQENLSSPNPLPKSLKDLNRILWISLPILSALLALILSNYNFYSTIFSFIMLTAAFIAVGIYRFNLPVVLIASLLYILIDNYLCYGQTINITGLKRQLIMLAFIIIVDVGRSFAQPKTNH